MTQITPLTALTRRSSDADVVVPPLAPPLNLAEVLARIEANPTLSVRSRRDLTAALHTLSRVLDVDLEMLPAQPPLLRERIASASPIHVGIKERHWANVRSLTIRALSHAGIRVLPGRSRAGLRHDWERLSC